MGSMDPELPLVHIIIDGTGQVGDVTVGLKSPRLSAPLVQLKEFQLLP